MDWKSSEVEAQEGGDRFVVSRPSLVVGLIGGKEVLSSAERILDFWVSQGRSGSALFGLGGNARSFRAMTAGALGKLRKGLQSTDSIDFYMMKDAPGFDIGS